jgi:hypothetical protein
MTQETHDSTAFYQKACGFQYYMPIFCTNIVEALEECVGSVGENYTTLWPKPNFQIKVCQLESDLILNVRCNTYDVLCIKIPGYTDW